MEARYDFGQRYNELKQGFANIRNACFQYGGNLELGEGNRANYSKSLFAACQKHVQGVREFYEALYQDSSSKGYNWQTVAALYPQDSLSMPNNIACDEHFVDNLGNFLELYDNPAIE